MPLGYDSRPLLARGSRESRASGVTPEIIRGERGLKGDRGLPGVGGSYTTYIFRRQEDQPSTPIGQNPAGWTDAPPPPEPDYFPLWMSKAVKTATGALISAWSVPVQLTGDEGTYIEYIFKRSTTLPATPTGNEPVGWFDTPPAATEDLLNVLWMSKAAKNLMTEELVEGASWSTPVALEGSSVFVEYSATGTGGWHSTFTSSDTFMRQRIGTGPWSGAIRIGGEDGDYIEYIFLRASSQPATPTAPTMGGVIAAGWYDAPPSGSAHLWMSKGAFNHLDILQGTWSTPIRLTGENGANGAPGTNGVDGVNGEDGIFREFVWKRASSQPSTPTGNGIPSGWSDDPPTGTLPLWMSVAKQELNGVLLSAWSTPIRHDGPAGPAGANGTNGADGSDGNSVLVQYSSNGSSGWHWTFSSGDLFMRQSTDGGSTWTAAIRIVGEEGAGIEVQYSVNGVDGWHDTFTTGDIYMRQRVAGGTWSSAIRIVGEKGDPGDPGTVTFAAAPTFSFEEWSSNPSFAYCTVYNNEGSGITTWAYNDQSGSFTGSSYTLTFRVMAWNTISAYTVASGKAPATGTGAYEYGTPP